MSITQATRRTIPYYIDRLLLLLSVLFSQSVYANSALAECEQLIQQGQYAQATQLSQNQQHNQQVGLLMCGGRAYFAMQQYAQAQQSFKQALTHDPQGLDIISTYLLLGNVYNATSQWQEAISQYNTAATIAKTQNLQRYVMIAHLLKGETYAKQTQYQLALKAYQDAEALAMNDNERADCFAHLASAYQGLEQLDKAIEFQLKTVLMQKKSGTLDDYAEASLLLGQLFHANKDYSGADKTYQRLWQFAKDNGGDYYVAKTSLYWTKTKIAMNDVAGATKLHEEATAIAQRIQDKPLLELLTSKQLGQN